MAFGQGVATFWGMAFGAEFFRLFFLHGLEAVVIGVVGQFGRCLLRGVEQEEENGGAGDDKGDVQVQGLDSFVGCGRHGFVDVKGWKKA